MCKCVTPAACSRLCCVRGNCFSRKLHLSTELHSPQLLAQWLEATHILSSSSWIVPVTSAGADRMALLSPEVGTLILHLLLRCQSTAGAFPAQLPALPLANVRDRPRSGHTALHGEPCFLLPLLSRRGLQPPPAPKTLRTASSQKVPVTFPPRCPPSPTAPAPRARSQLPPASGRHAPSPPRADARGRGRSV